MRPLCLPALAAALTCALGLSRPAAGQDSAAAVNAAVDVVIVSMTACCQDHAWKEAEDKAGAELSALQFSVEVIEGTAADEQGQYEELEQAVEQGGVTCAVRFSLSPDGGGGADLFIVDAATGDRVFRRMTVPEASDAEAASVIALRVVETLQASLLELTSGVGPVEPAGEENAAGEEEEEKVEPPAATPLPPVEDIFKKPPEKKKMEPGKVGLRLGLSALGSPGGTDVMGAVNLSLRGSVASFLSLELDNAITLLSRPIRSGIASSSFDIAVLRGWILWDFLRHRIVRVSAGGGAGLLLAWSTGFGPRAVEAETDLTNAAYVGATVQIAFVLTENLWLRLGFNAGAALPAVTIYFFGEEMADFGLPLMEGFLNLEIRVP
jgi:hypothetical protein